MNPLPSFTKWRRDDRNAAKLYGSIVAQARLPIFYQGFGVPDTLEGRFLVLSLHLFAVLHRLKAEGLAGAELGTRPRRPLQRRYGDGAAGDRHRRHEHPEEG